jgi:hypothetical protein
MCGDPERSKAIAQLLEGIARDVPLMKKNLREGKDISGSLDRLLGMLDKLSGLVADGVSEEELQAELMQGDLGKMEECVEEGSLLVSQLDVISCCK